MVIDRLREAAERPTIRQGAFTAICLVLSCALLWHIISVRHHPFRWWALPGAGLLYAVCTLPPRLKVPVYDGWAYSPAGAIAIPASFIFGAAPAALLLAALEWRTGLTKYLCDRLFVVASGVLALLASSEMRAHLADRHAHDGELTFYAAIVSSLLYVLIAWILRSLYAICAGRLSQMSPLRAPPLLFHLGLASTSDFLRYVDQNFNRPLAIVCHAVMSVSLYYIVRSFLPGSKDANYPLASMPDEEWATKYANVVRARGGKRKFTVAAVSVPMLMQRYTEGLVPMDRLSTLSDYLQNKRYTSPRFVAHVGDGELAILYPGEDHEAVVRDLEDLNELIRAHIHIEHYRLDWGTAVYGSDGTDYAAVHTQARMRMWQWQAVRSNRDRTRLAREQNQAAIGQQLARVSHEFANFLATLKYLLRKSDITVPELREAMAPEIDRHHQKVRSLMTVARPPEPHPRMCTTGELRRSVKQAVELVAIRHDADVDMQCTLPEEVLETDLGQVEEIVSNLARNAFRAAADMVTVQIESGWLGYCIYVENNGEPISEETARNLFRPFFTTKERDVGGYGLAIARDAARALGGDLTLAAKEPVKFCLIIPRKPPSAHTS